MKAYQRHDADAVIEITLRHLADTAGVVRRTLLESEQAAVTS